MSSWLPLQPNQPALTHTYQATNASAMFVYRCFANEFFLVRARDDTVNEQARSALPAVGSRLQESQLPCIADVIATEVELCIRLRDIPGATEQALQHLQCLLDSWVASPSLGKQWSLPVYFSTEDDWPALEAASALNREQIIERLLQLDLRLAMYGFLPGFAYLSGLPEELHFERKHIPTTTTQPGSVAFGGRYLGIYSLPSPAGWNVVGVAGVSLMHGDRTPPLAMQPGDALRIQRISANELSSLQAAATTLQQWCGL